jgi:hypothetical protein
MYYYKNIKYITGKTHRNTIAITILITMEMLRLTLYRIFKTLEYRQGKKKKVIL